LLRVRFGSFPASCVWNHQRLSFILRVVLKHTSVCVGPTTIGGKPVGAKTPEQFFYPCGSEAPMFSPIIFPGGPSRWRLFSASRFYRFGTVAAENSANPAPRFFESGLWYITSFVPRPVPVAHCG
jgi:hypothetical protein